MNRIRHGAAQSGFTMIEVLVTLVILLIGLLGLAALQSRAQVLETESYQRTQALVLLRDIAGRVSANRISAASYVTGTTTMAIVIIISISVNPEPRRPFFMATARITTC